VAEYRTQLPVPSTDGFSVDNQGNPDAKVVVTVNRLEFKRVYPQESCRVDTIEVTVNTQGLFSLGGIADLDMGRNLSVRCENAAS
jgi:hypothetical protein